MRRLVVLTSFISMMFWSQISYPCGGGFGNELTMKPTQTLILRHSGTEETYVFRPSFCGKSVDFGLILPIPDTLTGEPTVIDQEVYDAFDALTAPTIKKEKICSGRYGSGFADAGADSKNGSHTGVNVIDGGKVDIFDWVLLHADDSAAFTDWLDSNQYPYETDAVPHFAHYVEKSWYFIAFKVTATQGNIDAESTICGDFGPVQLTFKTDKPVVPARIAAVGDGKNSQFSWRIHVLAPHHVTARETVDQETMRFRGEITADRVLAFPAIDSIAKPGDRLTSVRLGFWGNSVDQDIVFERSAEQDEYRQTLYETVMVDCDGTACSVSGTPGKGSLRLASGLLLAAGLLLITRRRKQR